MGTYGLLVSNLNRVRFQKKKNTTSMAPTSTRSRSSASTPSSVDHTPSPRKSPCCKTCRRPMLGHPKSSCPKNSKDHGTEDTESDREQPPTEALRFMTLTSPAQEKEESKGSIREQSSRLDTQLHGTASDVFGSRPTKQGRHSMPGTLIPPISADSSIASAGVCGFQEEESAPKTEVTLPFEGSVAYAIRQRGQALSRSMSAMDRDLFIFQLASQAAATSLVIPKADAEAIRDRATALKFTSHLVMNDDDDDPLAVLILGREESSVRNLVQKVEEVNKSGARCKETGSVAYKTAAGAALVGAVVSWAGLAFS